MVWSLGKGLAQTSRLVFSLGYTSVAATLPPASTLGALGVTRVVNATVDLPNHFEECFEYLRVPIEDTPDTCLEGDMLEGDLHKALEFVAAGSAATLVHCHFGVSRSDCDRLSDDANRPRVQTRPRDTKRGPLERLPEPRLCYTAAQVRVALA